MKLTIQPNLVPALLLAGSLLPAALHAQNLILNGDFSAGNTGFTSGYIFSPSGQSAVTGTYGIRSFSQDFNSAFNAFSDHTSGGGNMMMVDGSTSSGGVVWQESVSVTPNGSYFFSGWATSANNENPPLLRFYINGVQAASDFQLSASSPGAWQPFNLPWNSGANSSATIAIVDLNTISLGNDFALDDFSFLSTTNISLATAFTYQGQLNSGGMPANGNYDLAFTLFATNTSGVAIAGPVTNTAVAVANGLFTTRLDFGSAFSGAKTWLEIAVSPNGANTFTTLTPRQPITPTPYALFAATANNANTAITASTAANVSGPVSASQITGTISNGNLPLSIYDYSGNLVAGTYAASTNITSSLGNNNGGDNVALGDYAFTADTSGYYNTAVGYYSMNGNSSGSENTGLGAGALQNNTSGYQNTAVGFQALFSTGGAGQDTAVGYHALLSTYGGNNTALGYIALSAVTGGSADTAVGSQSMQLTTGSGNTALGFASLYSNTGGGDNTAIGESAMFGGTANGASVAVGQNALAYNYNGGNYNIAIGNGALAIAGGGNNVAVGAYAMDTGNSVNNNTAVGFQALGNSPGDQNIALGYRAGNNLNSGTCNIYIGNPGGSSESDTIRIGDPNIQNNTYIAGVINGNGAGLTNLNATQLFNGAVSLPGLQLQPDNNGSWNVIAGSAVNYIAPGVSGAVIAGGGTTNFYGLTRSNTVSGDLGTVSGGAANNAAGTATVGGGFGNTASGYTATIAGGVGGLASGQESTVGGGYVNTATNYGSTVAGGHQNNANGVTATVCGGELNSADGADSIVEGGGFNTAYDDYATISGGEYNEASSPGATVGGGYYNDVQGGYSVIGGGSTNYTDGDNATISGGSGNGAWFDYATVGGGNENIAFAQFATVGGGGYNYTSYYYSQAATISGGYANTNAGYAGTIGGGIFNNVNAAGATIGGGTNNSASGQYSTISGGSGNSAGGQYATVAGGHANSAAGDFSFAGGNHASAPYQGDFVWTDDNGGAFTATGLNQFYVRAGGGVAFYSSSDLSTGATLAPGSGSWSSLSDRNAKENFQTVDAQSVLQAVMAMPMTTWNYKTQAQNIRHIGPMAQDFSAAFHVGETNTMISTVDEGGVALAAIQGLNQKLEEQKAENSELKKQLADLKTLIEQMAQGRQK